MLIDNASDIINSININKRRRFRVLVTGGSLGGLYTALALQCIDCDVEIFEKSPGKMKSRGAGIVAQIETIEFLREHGIATEKAVSVPVYKRQYLNRDGTIEWEEQTLQLMTSWDAI